MRIRDTILINPMLMVEQRKNTNIQKEEQRSVHSITANDEQYNPFSFKAIIEKEIKKHKK